MANVRVVTKEDLHQPVKTTEDVFEYIKRKDGEIKPSDVAIVFGHELTREALKNLMDDNRISLDIDRGYKLSVHFY